MWFEGPREVTGRIEDTCPEFTLDIQLKSAGHFGDYEASESSPPMPFAASSLGLYRLGYKYLLHDGAAGLSIEFGNPVETSRITIIQSSVSSGRRGSGRKLTVYLDGVEVGSHEGGVEIGGPYSVGRGFKKRFWRGDIDHVDFLPRALNIVPSAKAPRLIGGRDLIKSGHRAGFPA